MAYDIDEPSESLRTLHEAVVRFLERQQVALKQRNVWSYAGPSPKPHVDVIVLEFMHVASAQSLASWPLANVVMVEGARAIEAIDALLPHLAPVLEMVDQIAGVEFAPGSHFTQPSVQNIKRLAPSIHRTATRGAEFRVGLVEILNMLSAFVPEVSPRFA